MGRNNKAYSKDLHQQAYDRLTGMLAFGRPAKAVRPLTKAEKAANRQNAESYARLAATF